MCTFNIRPLQHIILKIACRRDTNDVIYIADKSFTSLVIW